MLRGVDSRVGQVTAASGLQPALAASASPNGSSIAPAPEAAGFATRAVAFVVDAVLVSVSLAIGIWVGAQVAGLLRLSFEPRGNLATIATGTAVAVGWTIVYFAGCWRLVGATPGKALMGLRVISRGGRHLTLPQAIVRLLCYPVAALPLGLGFAWVLIDNDRRSWPDMLARTSVVHAPSRR